MSPVASCSASYQFVLVLSFVMSFHAVCSAGSLMSMFSVL